MKKIKIGLLASAAAMLAMPALSQAWEKEYQPDGIPVVIPPLAVPNTYEDQLTFYEFEVTENFRIEEIEVVIDWFAAHAGIVEIYLDTPWGARISVSGNICGFDEGGSRPARWGTTTFNEPYDPPLDGDPTIKTSTTATYTFASNGDGETAHEICVATSEDQAEYMWDWGQVAPEARVGRWFKMPVNRVYNFQDPLESVRGEVATGTWALVVDNFIEATDHSPFNADVLVNSAIVTFSGSAPIDEEPPEVTLAQNQDYTNLDDPYVVTFTSSESLEEFDLEVFEVENAELWDLTEIDDNVWEFTVASLDYGPMVVRLPVEAVSDLAGNFNQETVEVVINPDTVFPTVDISAPNVSAISDQTPFVVQFSWSEAVVGFELTDIEVENASHGEFVAISSTEYTATVYPTAKGDVTVHVPAEAALDNSNEGNPSLASEVFTLKNVIIQLTQEAIRKFVTARMDTIVSNEPELYTRLTQRAGAKDSAFSAMIEPGEGNISFSTSLAALNKPGQKLPYDGGPMRKTGLLGDVGQNAQLSAFDVWASGTYVSYDRDEQEQTTGLLYIGADWLISDATVLGILAQSDWTKEDTSGSSADGRGIGFMVGPYVVHRLTDNLVFDARGALGKSWNEVKPTGTWAQVFDTDRFLVSSSLTGVTSFADFRVEPAARLIYMEEEANEFEGTFGNIIPSQIFSLGRLAVGPKISKSFEMDGGTFMPFVKAEALYDWKSSQGYENTFAKRSRARLSSGFGYVFDAGWALSADGFYDGFGHAGIQSFGGTLRLSKGF